MVKDSRSLLAALGAILLSSTAGAYAQNSSDGIIGPPQLKDFSLQPRETIVPGRPPSEAEPVTVAPPPPVVAPGPAEARPEPPQRAAAPTPADRPRQEPSASSARSSAPESPAEGPAAPQPAPETESTAPAPIAAAPAPYSAPAGAVAPIAPAESESSSGGTPYWYFALPAVALALLGLAFVRRRRAFAGPVGEPAAASLAAPPPAPPRPDPVPRPWLELALKAERAAFTAAEAEIAFELEISNKGGSAARNLRIDVKLFNAGAEQDKEIGAFFRTAGRESTKVKLPGVAAGVSGVIQGTVGMKREDIRAMRLDERLLFIPVIAVNVLYDWGDGRTGQTSKSYIIGRETQAAGEKMGAFRVDQGPRIWRTVGQRPTKLARRV